MVLVSDVQIPPPPPLIFQSYQIVISFSGPCEIAPFFAGVTVGIAFDRLYGHPYLSDYDISIAWCWLQEGYWWKPYRH